jgi:hypothetical protein
MSANSLSGNAGQLSHRSVVRCASSSPGDTAVVSAHVPVAKEFSSTVRPVSSSPGNPARSRCRVTVPRALPMSAANLPSVILSSAASPSVARSNRSGGSRAACASSHASSACSPKKLAASSPVQASGRQEQETPLAGARAGGRSHGRGHA